MSLERETLVPWYNCVAQYNYTYTLAHKVLLNVPYNTNILSPCFRAASFYCFVYAVCYTCMYFISNDEIKQKCELNWGELYGVHLIKLGK